MLYVNDGTEFSIGGRSSGIVIRYRRKIRGVIVLIRNREFSWVSYKRLRYMDSVTWKSMVRLPWRTYRW